MTKIVRGTLRPSHPLFTKIADASGCTDAFVIRQFARTIILQACLQIGMPEYLQTIAKAYPNHTDLERVSKYQKSSRIQILLNDQHPFWNLVPANSESDKIQLALERLANWAKGAIERGDITVSTKLLRHSNSEVRVELPEISEIAVKSESLASPPFRPKKKWATLSVANAIQIEGVLQSDA